MYNFELQLKEKIKKSLYNDFGKDNYDLIRFGVYPEMDNKALKFKTKNTIKRLIGYKKNKISDSYIDHIEYKAELNWLWNVLDENGKSLLIELIAYRILGYKKVKLSVNNNSYTEALGKADKLADNDDWLDPNFMHFILHKMYLKEIGYEIQLYFTPLAVAIDFILEQYAYKQNNKTIIEAELGDTVLDIGGCWGDTALYFAEKVGSNGKVYSFEFIPGNILIYNRNIGLNPRLKTRIELVEHPVTDETGKLIYYKDAGPGSQVRLSPFNDQTGTTTTISIDDFVEQNQLSKIDFIKMDIEGAEPVALKGAIRTITKYRPKLAIAIYHSMNDFVGIPKWIDNLGLGYKLFLGHYTIHSEETVIFAKCQD
jgi:FkbM family methyltransferase